MKYTKKTLISGREVNIRPLTWNEFWEVNKERNQLAAFLQSRTVGQSEEELLEKTRAVREKGLKLCVEDWADTSADLSLPEVLEIESIIEELSKAPVREGNC